MTTDHDDGNGNGRRGEKSATAFRTISEVADDLQVPQHVLRFWEGRFPQIKPLKRAGGRRYYRPEDVVLLGRIRDLLYKQGYTIKGVQNLLKTGGASPPDTSDDGMEDDTSISDTPESDEGGEPFAIAPAPELDESPLPTPTLFDPPKPVAVPAANDALRHELLSIMDELEAIRLLLLP